MMIAGIRTAIVCILGVVACCAIARASSPEVPGWRLVWSDEFSGTAVDPARWNAENVAWPYNNELEFYLPQQATVGGGVLNIKAERRNHGGRQYVSARLNTRTHWGQQYGRFEASIKVPVGQGYWPAFWLLPTSEAWPPEIDIMETIGSRPNTVYLTHHWGTVTNVMSHGITWDGPNFTTGYHRFAVEWSPNRIDWLVDGVVRFSTTANIPHEPMYLLVNLAIGGNLPGNPNASTVFPQSMLVDWVRAYMRDVPLVNGGFEEPASGGAPSGWQTFGNVVQSSTGAQTGAKSVRLSGTAGPGPYYTGLFQDLPASPGQNWAATASAMHTSADPLRAGNFVDLKIEWFNHANQPIGVELTTALTDASPRDVAIPVSVQAVAPAGTAKARLAIVHVQPGSQFGSAHFDDVTFGYSTPGVVTPCAADFNGTAGVTVQDIFDFLAAYFASSPRADFNLSGAITVQDLFDFLAVYFRPCGA